MPDNRDRPGIWRDRQARFTVGDLVRAIRELFCDCNQADRWDISNDCQSPDCALFPYRPGEQRPEVLGVRRAAKSAKRAEQGRKNIRNAHGGRNKAPRTGDPVPVRVSGREQR